MRPLINTLENTVSSCPEAATKQPSKTLDIGAGLMLTVCHRTFSGQFRHLSNQFHYLTGQICTGNHIDQTSILENVRTRCLTYHKPCRRGTYTFTPLSLSLITQLPTSSTMRKKSVSTAAHWITILTYQWPPTHPTGVWGWHTSKTKAQTTARWPTGLSTVGYCQVWQSVIHHSRQQQEWGSHMHSKVYRVTNKYPWTHVYTNTTYTISTHTHSFTNTHTHTQHTQHTDRKTTNIVCITLQTDVVGIYLTWIEIKVHSSPPSLPDSDITMSNLSLWAPPPRDAVFSF